MFRPRPNRLFRPAIAGLHIQHPDGTRYVLRGLSPRDGKALAAHLSRLSPEDRRLRFHGAMSDAGIRAYCARIDWPRRVVMGVYSERLLRGAGELVIPEECGPADLALSVERAYRHAALGRILMAAMLTAARLAPVDEVRFLFLGENDAMRSIARDIGARLSADGAVTEAVVALRAAEVQD